MPATEWTRISRVVGTLDVQENLLNAGQVVIRIRTAPRMPEGWQAYFGAKVIQLGVYAVHDSFGSIGSDWNGITADGPQDDFERVVEAIDLAIEYANDNYEANVLPNVLATQEAKEQKAAEAAKRQADLKERVAKLDKPPPEPA
jgi:hypothetical protein